MRVRVVGAPPCTQLHSPSPQAPEYAEQRARFARVGSGTRLAAVLRMNARLSCCIAWLSLVPACAAATSPDLGAENAEAGAGGVARAGSSALGGAFPSAGRAAGGAGSAGNSGVSGAAMTGGSGAGSASGAGGSSGSANGGTAGTAQGGSPHAGQAGSSLGGQGGSAQGGAAAGSAGATGASCAPHVFAWADAQHTLKTVAVTGSFNAWSTTGNALAYDAATHRWTLPLTMTAGMQQYKFIIDGSSEWKADPANSNTVADGFGGVNSVLDCP